MTTRGTAAAGIGVLVLVGAVLLAGIVLLRPGSGAAAGTAGVTGAAATAGTAGTAGGTSSGTAGPAASSCATPAPLASTGVCTAPSAGSTATGAAGAAAGASGSDPGAGAPAIVSATDPSSPSAGSAAGSTAAASPGAAASPPAGSPAPSNAPTSAVGFKVRGTVVPMAFPLPATAKISYGDGWRAPRDGVALPYEQIRGVRPDGSYMRAHDGIDIKVKLGTPVYAPFSGTVVDPRPRWKPWDPSRYGKVVVIESTEPTSTGYTVILAHLSTTKVKVGDTVERGQLVGKTGKTGNAAGTPPHLHLELRAPFKITYGYAHVIRKLDVFDAEPSVRAADPKAR